MGHMLTPAAIPERVFVEFRCGSCRRHAPQRQAPMVALVARGVWDEPDAGWVVKELTIFTPERGVISRENPSEHFVHRLGGTGELWWMRDTARGVQWREAGGWGDSFAGYSGQVDLSCSGCRMRKVRNTDKILREAVAETRRGNNVRYVD